MCDEIKEIIPIVGLIVSISTLGFGIYAFNKFIGNEAAKQQLALVLELVKILNTSRFLLTFFGEKNAFKGYKLYNLYQLSNFTRPQNEPNFSVHQPRLYSIPMGTNEIVNNPLLPYPIANSLLKFHNSFKSELKRPFSEMKGNYYVIGDTNQGNAELLPVETFQYFEGGINGLIYLSSHLKLTIITWLKSKGVKEINTTIFDVETL